MRSEGMNNFDDIEAVVFESDAKLTIIPKSTSDKQNPYQEQNNSVSQTIQPLL